MKKKEGNDVYSNEKWIKKDYILFLQDNQQKLARYNDIMIQSHYYLYYLFIYFIYLFPFLKIFKNKYTCIFYEGG
jgi:hypothetical protein